MREDDTPDGATDPETAGSDRPGDGTDPPDTGRGGAVRALGEVALRVEDLPAMRSFYRDTLGLPVLGAFDDAVFFSLGESHGGHTAVLALFDRTGDPGYRGIDPDRSTVDHLAFAVDVADYESEAARLRSLGYDVETATHEWVSWRSLYLADPEGNRVELVCHDPTV